MDADALIPLEIRLQSLEAQIRDLKSVYPDGNVNVDGVDGVDEVKKGSRSAAKGDGGGDVSRRHASIVRQMRNTQEVMERLGGESEALKRLLAGYEAYKPFLSLPGEEDDSVNDLIPIPDQTKVTLCLESADEVVSAERDLREIGLLEARGVAGSGELESLLPLRPDLKSHLTQFEVQRKVVISARTEVLALLRRYREFSSTVSDLFLELHRQLQSLEEDVRRAERRRAKEVKERY